MSERNGDSPDRNPWDQQPDEPAAAYARFLVYLHLGPARSIDAACRMGRAANRSKSQRATGTWFDDSRTYHWPARALAWDIAQLSTQGQRAVVGFVAAIEAYTLRVVAALEDLPRPKTWPEATEAMLVLSSLIPAETILSLSSDAPLPPAVRDRAGTGLS